MNATSKNQMDSADESVLDREFLSELVAVERERLLLALRSSQSEDVANAGVFDAAIDQMAELSARIQLLECASELGLMSSVSQGAQNESLYAERRVNAMQLGASHAFHQTLESGDGGSFLWTRVARLEFDLPVQRLRTRYLRIRFASIIKTEYARTARLTIDGDAVRCWLGRTESDYFIECAMPVSENLVSSRIVLEIDGAHSPSELGLSDDDRPLGIAIIAAEYSNRPEGKVLTRIRRRINPLTPQA